MHAGLSRAPSASVAGLFEEADGGTLFLDEVGELSLRAQAKLLRAIQDGEIRRVGESLPRRVDARIVAATNRRLADEADCPAFPRRPAVPARRDPHQRPAAARTSRRHPAAGARVLDGSRGARRQPGDAARRDPGRARALPLARQRPRAAECRAGAGGQRPRARRRRALAAAGRDCRRRWPAVGANARPMRAGRSRNASSAPRSPAPAIGRDGRRATWG